MINKIEKLCVNENIEYERKDDQNVYKRHYTKSGKCKKEKIINVREVHQNRRSHKNTQDFFEDMIINYGYHEID